MFPRYLGRAGRLAEVLYGAKCTCCLLWCTELFRAQLSGCHFLWLLTTFSDAHFLTWSRVHGCWLTALTGMFPPEPFIHRSRDLGGQVPLECVMVSCWTNAPAMALFCSRETVTPDSGNSWPQCFLPWAIRRANCLCIWFEAVHC